jgi:hypothetical protein
VFQLNRKRIWFIETCERQFQERPSTSERCSTLFESPKRNLLLPRNSVHSTGQKAKAKLSISDSGATVAISVLVLPR